MKSRHALLALLALTVSLGSLDAVEAQRSGRRSGGKRDGANLTEEQRQAMQEKRAQRAEGTATDEQRQAMREQRAQQLGELGLSEEQRAQIQALRETHRTQMQDRRALGQPSSPEEMQEIRQKQQDAIGALLTPDQRNRLAELRAERPGQGDGSTRRRPRAARGQ